MREYGTPLFVLGFLALAYCVGGAASAKSLHGKTIFWFFALLAAVAAGVGLALLISGE